MDVKEITAEPSVDFLNSAMSEPLKSSIGVRKIQPKKGGIGAKKGLGATKVKTNFADIEQRANMADQKKEPVEKKLTEEEEAEAITSVRLAYKDLSLKKEKEEERLKMMDPRKAKQMERLGMGFNVKGGVSHSMMTDMQTITQDTPTLSSNNGNNGNSKFATKNFDRENSNDFFDDYSTSMYSNNNNNNNNSSNAGGDSSNSNKYRDAAMMGFETIEPIESNTKIQSMFSSEFSSKSSKFSDVNDRQPVSVSSTSGSSSRRSNKEVKSPANDFDSDSIQKKFGGAKAISSDQFFGNEQSSFERSANLSRFQGSNSISSADYFGDGTQATTTARREFFLILYFQFFFKISIEFSGGPSLQFTSPDLDDVKESVRQGVTKVAGRLSSLASDVSGYIQDKYGH